MTVIKELSNNKTATTILFGLFCWGVWLSKSVMELQFSNQAANNSISNIERTSARNTEIISKQQQLLFQIDTRLKIQEGD